MVSIRPMIRYGRVVTCGPPIPATIVSGFLGAGKTTVLNHLLRSPLGIRLGVLVNDFGDVDIDAELVARSGTAPIALPNGCICCTIRDDLIGVLSGIGDWPERPDHLVVEASGISDPEALADLFGLPSYDPPVPLFAVVTVVDAELVREQAADWGGRVLLKQLAAADLVVLNKVDLASEEALSATRAWIEESVPGARIVEAVRGEVPPEVLLADTPERRDERGPRGTGEPSREPGPASPAPSAQAKRSAPHDPRAAAAHGYETASFESDRPFSRSALEAAVSGLPTTVVRAKGVLFMDDTPERRAVLQVVGRRVTIEPGEPWGDAPPRSRIALIGPSGRIDADLLLQGFERALAGAFRGSPAGRGRSRNNR